VIGMVLYLTVAVALSAALYFVWPIAALSDVAPVDALKNSLKFLQAHLVPIIVLAVVTGLIGGAGLIACLVGVYVTMPIAITMCVLAYNEHYLPNAPK
jgi:uncharacterized membrane protein